MSAGRSLYVIASAAPPVLGIAEGIDALQQRWNVSLILSPAAASWIDVDKLAATTGCLVRSEARLPTEQDPLPKADAILAAPLTFNTLNKWAAGIADTLAVAILCELLGTGVPITAVPCVKQALREHPAYSDSITRLREAGVRFVDADPLSHRRDDGLVGFDWSRVAREM
ncbi:flavoprotein [Haloechinothrix halophila]|uniref:flavoprotein n=1 Tax=Haloechinothrix halophila TaxID=1069073 RepID=UPI000426B5BB|nr:flavoprotein [Haloechinothrix halophila]